MSIFFLNTNGICLCSCCSLLNYIKLLMLGIVLVYAAFSITCLFLEVVTVCMCCYQIADYDRCVSQDRD